MNVLRPLACLLPDAARTAALLILNHPLEKRLLQQLWSCSVFRAVTDGGSNRLFMCFDGEQDKYIPDIITGDFDSAKESVLDFYRQKDVDIIATPNQDATDFTKCMVITVDKTQTMQVEELLVFGGLGGRVDHSFASIETLYTAAGLTEKPIYLISGGSLTCLLPQGKTVIHADTGFEGEWCGLIPVGQRCEKVTTTGLKWNLDGQPLGFGELISTSNTYTDKVVTIETDKPLLWTMGYRFPEDS